MHTAAIFDLADKNKMVSKFMDRCSPAKSVMSRFKGVACTRVCFQAGLSVGLVF